MEQPRQRPPGLVPAAGSFGQLRALHRAQARSRRRAAQLRGRVVATQSPRSCSRGIRQRAQARPRARLRQGQAGLREDVVLRLERAPGALRFRGCRCARGQAHRRSVRLSGHLRLAARSAHRAPRRMPKPCIRRPRRNCARTKVRPMEKFASATYPASSGNRPLPYSWRGCTSITTVAGSSSTRSTTAWTTQARCANDSFAPSTSSSTSRTWTTHRPPPRYARGASTYS